MGHILGQWHTGGIQFVNALVRRPVVQRARLDIEQYRAVVQVVKVGLPFQQPEAGNITANRGRDVGPKLGRVGILRHGTVVDRGSGPRKKTVATEVF